MTTITGWPGMVTVALDGSLVTGGPLGGVPVAVAVLVTVPASASAWVSGYGAMQVSLSPGARTELGGAAGRAVTPRLGIRGAGGGGGGGGQAISDGGAGAGDGGACGG